MPRAGMRWRHVNFHPLNSWFPGSPKGFRTWKHKLHSSGDYKRPPPQGEHAGLYRYSQKISGKPVVLPPALREVIGFRILKKLQRYSYRVLAISVGARHVHVLVELPADRATVKSIIGECKAVSSHAVRKVLPGRAWAHGGKFEAVDSRDHQVEAFFYILDHAEEGAWVWAYREITPELIERGKQIRHAIRERSRKSPRAAKHKRGSRPDNLQAQG